MAEPIDVDVEFFGCPAWPLLKRETLPFHEPPVIGHIMNVDGHAFRIGLVLDTTAFGLDRIAVNATYEGPWLDPIAEFPRV